MANVDITIYCQGPTGETTATHGAIEGGTGAFTSYTLTEDVSFNGFYEFVGTYDDAVDTRPDGPFAIVIGGGRNTLYINAADNIYRLATCLSSTQTQAAADAALRALCLEKFFIDAYDPDVVYGDEDALVNAMLEANGDLPRFTAQSLSRVGDALTALAAKFAGMASLPNWLGALFGKSSDASTLTEINATTGGATFDNSTDSAEAIRDRGDAAWTGSGGGGGSGDYQITITVEDGDSNGVQGAKVSILGGNYGETSNANGELTLNVDAGSYTLITTPPSGYATPSNQALDDVNADRTATVTLTETGESSEAGWLG
jgi:hypothetical protein